MKAIVQDRYGPPDVLELRDIDTPVPGAGEVLVRVRAASVNAADWHVMRGDPYVARAMLGLRAPRGKTRGRDCAGTVESVGPQVRRFAPGDDVYAEADGTFAEYVRVREDRLETKPANLSFEQAAAIPLAGTTALLGVRDLGRVAAGQRVLVNGASGGVGPFAVQLAKAYGAEVTGVCSARNAELVRSVGADHVVDYGQADFTATGQRYDVVLDLVGNRSLADLRRALTPAGTLVLSGGGPSGTRSMLGPVGLLLRGLALSRFARPQRLLGLTARAGGGNLATLRQLAESGALTPVIDRTYPLDQVPEAIRYMETEHARAKVAITV